MIYFLVLLIAIALFISGGILNYTYKKHGVDGDNFIGAGIVVIFVFAMMSLFVIVGNLDTTKDKNIQYDKIKIELKEIQEDQNLYSNDLIISITNDVKSWNDDIKFGKDYQRNFWIGIFIPNIYDDLSLIDYKITTKIEVEVSN